LKSLFGFKKYLKRRVRFIDNKSVVYRTIPFNLINKKNFTPAVSHLDEFDLSCDWNKYCTPSQSLEILSKQYKNSELKTFKDSSTYFVYSLSVKMIRESFNSLDAIHNPIYFSPEKINRGKRKGKIMY
jgi:hypothetical protein